MSTAVDIERVGNRIHAWIPYANGDGPKFAKRVRGAKWSPSEKVWTYPLEWNTCLRLREVFGASLRVGHELIIWSSAEKTRIEGMTALAKQRTADLSLVPQLAPALAEAFASRTYQQVGAKFCAEMRTTLLADQPRLGKTLQILGAVVEANVPGDYLLFVPGTAIQIVWEPEIVRWLGGLAVAIPVVGSREQREAALEGIGKPVGNERFRFFICNHEMAQIRQERGANGKPSGKRLAPMWPQLFRSDWAGIIVDESHEMLIGPNNPKTVSAQLFGARKIRDMNKDAIRIAASGTPARGKEWQLWSTFNWLRPDTYTSFWRWAEEYFEVDDDGYGKIIGAFRPGKQAAFDREAATVMLRRTTQEVRPELPARQYGGTLLEPGNPHSPIGVWLPMTPKQSTAYAKLLKEGVVPLLEGGEMIADGILAEMTRAKQLANCAMGKDGLTWKHSNKFDWLVEFLSERGITGDALTESGDSKIVVGSQFVAVLDQFRQGLEQRGIECLMLTGNVPQSKRPAIKREFDDDPAKRVFLIQTQTGGVAITLDVADEMVIVDETYIPDEQEQLEYRIDNAGGEIRPKMIWYIRSLATIDEGIARTTGARERAVKWILDGRRGVEQAKVMLAGGDARVMA